MKILYININNKQIQSNEELEVLEHDLDSDFFYLGEKIAKGCKVENENALITDFNTQDNEEYYKQIIAQWNELKHILFSEECEGEFEFTLPDGYIHWLKFHPQYVSVYDRNFSHSEPAVITIDLEELYEDSVEDLQRKILRKLQRDDLYLEINEVVFNDDAVTRKSPIVSTIKGKYEEIGFKAYKKWLQENEEKFRISSQVCDICKKNPCECNTKSISYCTDCNESYLQSSIDESDEDEDEEDIEIPNCPECGSDDVENDGTDYLQYECNECGHIWGDDEVYDNDDEEDYDDDTDNAGNQMSEYIESFDVIIGRSTKYDVQRKGGVLVNPDTGYGEYKMPNNIKVFFFNNNYTINHIAVHKEAANNIPSFYKQLGFYWGMPEYEFKQLFEGLGFYNVGKYDFKPEEIHAFKRCEKYNCTIELSVQYDWCLGGMWVFSIDCIPPHIKCD